MSFAEWERHMTARRGKADKYQKSEIASETEGAIVYVYTKL